MPNIYGAQLNIRWQDKAASHAHAREVLAGTPVEPGSLVVLPEMFDVGFTMNIAAATSTGADTRAFVAGLALDLRSTVVAGFASFNAEGKPANQAVVIDPNGTEICRYTKCQGFSPAGECEAYACGSGPAFFTWAGLKVAPLICYDLRFPELFRAGAKQGAEVFLVIANWPAARIDHWLTLARARAIENQAYVVAVNRCGSDPHLSYPGKSIIVDPKGAILAEAGGDVQVITARIEPDVVRHWRRDFPALRDARFL